MPYSHFPCADPHLRALILAALERCGLSPTLTRSVEALVPRVHDDWRVCCGSGCDPCIVPLARAVDMVRAELRLGPVAGGASTPLGHPAPADLATDPSGPSGGPT